MRTSETCQLRYRRPSGTEWRVERIHRSAAAFRKQALEGMGWIVVISGGGSFDDPAFACRGLTDATGSRLRRQADLQSRAGQVRHQADDLAGEVFAADRLGRPVGEAHRYDATEPVAFRLGDEAEDRDV